MTWLLLFLAHGQDGSLFGETGFRKDLRERGVEATLAWTGEVLAVVDGGLDEDAAAAMLLDLVVEADLETLAGWTGASALLNPMWIEGGGLTERDLGDLSVVSNIDAPDGVRLYEAWVQQAAAGDVFSLRAGLLAFDVDGALVPRASVFINSSFGAPSILALNVPAPVYPVGFLGARVRVQPTPDLYAFAAVYEGDAGDDRINPHGLTFRRPSNGEGLLTAAEAGIVRDALTLSLGGFLHTGEFEAFDGGAARGVHGGYALADVRLLAEPDVGAFVRAGLAREDRALASFTLEAGAAWKGPWPGRPDDILALGVGWIELSDDFRRAQPGDLDREVVVELTCRIAATPWLAVQPDVQFVRHPGGNPAVDDALVLALRVDLAF